jgi:2-amino-4-hydroxy-6-hydroxymethyldihydropteridine diphosphokinase
MPKGSHKIILHLGSNVGDRAKYLSAAQLELERSVLSLHRSSDIYETGAWGNRNQAAFLNQAHTGETTYSPFSLMRECKKIEHFLGRRKREKWGPREIDIDIIFYGSSIFGTSELTIPHPHLEQRRFVLLPIKSIAPKFRHPVSGQTIEDLLDQCDDSLHISIYNSNEYVNG